MINPIAILNNEEDSFPFLAHLNQNPPTKAAKTIIKNALIDWNTAAGLSFPIKGSVKESKRSVLFSVQAHQTTCFLKCTPKNNNN